jgi:uncharacterized protein (DUF934 family)
LRLLDRNGWTTSDLNPVPVESLDAALAAGAVALPNDYRAANLRPVQGRLALVSIDFPKFNDGRGFSIARSLRAQGYSGRLRASGALIPDQFAFALQCGFDEIEISDAQAERQPIEQWLHALGLIGASYQEGADGDGSIFQRRRAAAAAA